MLGWVVGALSFVGLGAQALGQASFSESFDNVGAVGANDVGPAGLMSHGWVFRRQASPSSYGAWNPYTQDWAHEGTGCLGIDASITNYGGTGAAWAILPAVAGLHAGDIVSLWVSQGYSNFGPPTGHLEVRYSPGGGTGTGSRPSDTGDFSVLLIDIAGVNGGEPWGEHHAAAPGPGRLALRFWQPVGGFTDYASNFLIDALTVGTPPPAAVPLPLPGQTVHWTTAGSPYVIVGTKVIPGGGTVIIDPGVTVRFTDTGLLSVEGVLDTNGTGPSHVTINSDVNYAPGIAANGGSVDLSFTDVHASVRPGLRGSITATDCTFNGNGWLGFTNVILTGNLAFYRLTRCTFDGGLGAWPQDGWLVMRNCSFSGGARLSVLRCCADIADCSSDGQGIWITREADGIVQPQPIGPVTVRNVPDGAGLHLEGGEFMLAPGSVLENNLYSLDLLGGLTPDSVVPTTGNTNNVVRVYTSGFAGTGCHWPNLGIPYRITEPRTVAPGGNLTISPGVIVEGDDADRALRIAGTRRLIASGLPEQPIVFRSAVPGMTWGGVDFDVNSTQFPRLEYCDVSGGAVGSSESAVCVNSCMIHDCEIGAIASNYGVLYPRSTVFTRNQLGVFTTPLGGVFANFLANPNSFVGNLTAVQANSPGNRAEGNWWNDASGPAATDNPGGLGEAVIGQITTVPFLTQAPAANHPPMVHLIDGGNHFNPYTYEYHPQSYLVPGSKIILTWTVDDDGTIVRQRVEISRNGPGERDASLFYSPVLDNLPGTARTCELTVPDVGFGILNMPQAIRVVATDSLGQEGFDVSPCFISTGDITGDLTVANPQDFAGRTFIAGDAIPAIQHTGSATNIPTITDSVILESDGHMFGNTFFSTDAARLAIRASNNSNQITWFFSDAYFSIRPDPRMGYTPPSVTLTSPAPGASYRGGMAVPIAWTAAAPMGFRSFDIMISTDGGRTFRLLAEDLPASARAYSWRLPNSTGIADVRVRVIVRDQKFQNSCSRTAAGDLLIHITPGGGCAADFNMSGAVSLQDIFDFLTAFFSGSLSADFNGSGAVSVQDVFDFIAAYFIGCP